MAKETVEAVRQAELNAAQKEKDAAQKKEAILLESQLNAKTLYSSMTKEALEKAENDIAKANIRGTVILEEAKEKAEKEALLMKEMAQQKEADAISLVLSNVI
ncbi:MAG: hypothetical protein WBI07_19100 [Mobilitalea sp.]